MDELMRDKVVVEEVKKPEQHSKLTRQEKRILKWMESSQRTRDLVNKCFPSNEGLSGLTKIKFNKQQQKIKAQIRFALIKAAIPMFLLIVFCFVFGDEFFTAARILWKIFGFLFSLFGPLFILFFLSKALKKQKSKG